MRGVGVANLLGQLGTRDPEGWTQVFLFQCSEAVLPWLVCFLHPGMREGTNGESILLVGAIAKNEGMLQVHFSHQKTFSSAPNKHPLISCHPQSNSSS